MAKKPVARFTATFEPNLEGIQLFLAEGQALQAFDGLRDELLGTVIPKLERVPGLNRSFLARRPRSVETTHALAALRTKLLARTMDKDALRETLVKDSLRLYALIGGATDLLALRHPRPLMPTKRTAGEFHRAGAASASGSAGFAAGAGAAGFGGR